VSKVPVFLPEGAILLRARGATFSPKGAIIWGAKKAP